MIDKPHRREAFGSRFGVLVTMAGVVFVLSIPPMINIQIFVPWDLAFGSGMQTLGCLFAVLGVGWSLDRAMALRQFAAAGSARARWLYLWLRYAVPAARGSVLKTDSFCGTGILDPQYRGNFKT